MCAQKNNPSLNGLVFKKAYTRLSLTAAERIIFQRLLGFLIRNNKPFPYSAVALAEITGYHKKTIFRALDVLEKKRLIKRVGMGKNRRFCRGSILDKILSTETNSLKKLLVNSSTTETLCPKKLNNRDIVSPNKTYIYLKRKEMEFSIRDLQQLNFYASNNFPIPEEESHLKEFIEEARNKMKN